MILGQYLVFYWRLNSIFGMCEHANIQIGCGNSAGMAVHYPTVIARSQWKLRQCLGKLWHWSRLWFEMGIDKGGPGVVCTTGWLNPPHGRGQGSPGTRTGLIIAQGPGRVVLLRLKRRCMEYSIKWPTKYSSPGETWCFESVTIPSRLSRTNRDLTRSQLK